MTALKEIVVATLTVRNLDEEVVRRLRIRAAENGRSAEAEHRALLAASLLETRPPSRQQAIDRLADFRQRTSGRESPSSADMLAESRAGRLQALIESHPAGGEAR
jgi:plasmid stability protein